MTARAPHSAATQLACFIKHTWLVAGVLAFALSAMACTSDPSETASPLMAHAEIPMALPWGKVVDIELSPILFFQYESGHVVAVGDSGYGQSGIPDKAGYSVLEPTLVPTIQDVEELFAGGRHTMALTSTGLWGWGTADYYQFGRTDVWTAVEPIQVALPGKPRALSLTGNTMGVILQDGSLWTWGQISFSDADPTPKKVDGLPLMDRLLNLWWEFSCAVDQQEQAWCWGKDEEFDARLRSPPNHQAFVPVRVPEWDHAVQVVSTSDSTFVLRTDGLVIGRGGNTYYSLGTGDADPRDDYVTIGLAEPTARLAVALWSVCALSVLGNIFCWGGNYQYELGTGDNVDRKLPTRLETVGPAVDIEPAFQGRCALDAYGDVFCWGATPVGWSPVPTKVDLPSLLRTP